MVLAIMAIISVLGISNFIVLRDQNLLESYSRGIISGIREAQNHAISTTPDKGGRDAKVWGLRVNNDSYELISLVENGGSTLAEFQEKKTELLPNMTVQLTTKDGAKTTPIYFFFSTPFGKAYQGFDSFLTPTGCTWKLSGKPTNDYGLNPIDCGSVYTSPDASNDQQNIYYKIQLKYHDKLGPVITIRSDGDIDLKYE
jgi:hypothetical protein